VRPLGPGEWRVVDSFDDRELTRGSEAHCKEWLAEEPRPHWFLEGPDGTFYQLLWDDNEPQWDPVGDRNVAPLKVLHKPRYSSTYMEMDRVFGKSIQNVRNGELL
jgi:hypothetical protein